MIIAFIGFLISSTIITGGGILMLNIIESTSTYLGESESVLVISNPRASTPYTSVLPTELADTINSLHGVLDVSPEVMTAAVYKDTAVYFRGVEVSKFDEYFDVDYIEGFALERNDTFDVSIGISFAERNKLSVGDYFTVFSTRSNSALELRVKSIFISGTLLDDEIIAPLWVGQFFSFETYNYVTHIRVRIDLNVIPDKEILRDLVTNEHVLSVNIQTPGSIQELNGTVYIRNKKGILITEEIFYNTNFVQLTLPFGEYEIQAEVGREFSEPFNFILLDNTTENVFVSYVEREVNVRIETSEDEPIVGAEVTIYRQLIAERALWGSDYVEYSDSNGEVSFTVSNGSYFIDAELGRYRQRASIVTQEVNDIEIELINRHPSIYVDSPINNSVIIGKSLNVSASATNGYSIYFYYDDNQLTIQEYFLNIEGVTSPPGILVPFDEGQHSITFIAFNEDYPGSGDKSRNYVESKLFFTMSRDYPETFAFTNALNGSQILPLSLLVLNSTLFFSQNTYYSWDNDGWTGVSDLNIIPVPFEEGIHRVEIKTETEDQSSTWSFYFVVTSSPDAIGTLGLPHHGVLPRNASVQVWYNTLASSILYHWDSNSDTPIPQDGIISTSGLDSGNHTLHLAAQLFSIWHFESYQIDIDNFAPNITLNEINGSLVESGGTIFLSSNETLSQVSFSWDSLAFSEIFEDIIIIPVENGLHTLEIKGEDLAGNLVNIYYEFTVVNSTGGIPIDFYLSHEYSGLINQSFIDLQVFTNHLYVNLRLTLIGPVSLSRYLLDSERIFLYPGEYDLEIEFNHPGFVQRTRQWNFQINSGLNSSNLTTNHINATHTGEITLEFPYFDYSSTLNQDSVVFLTDGKYDIISTLVGFPSNVVLERIEIDTQTPTLEIHSPNKGNEEMLVLLKVSSDAAKILFFQDQESILYTYDGIVLLDYHIPGTHTLTFIMTDSFYNTKTLVYSFNVGLDYVPINLTIQTESGGVFSPYSDSNITINSFYNSTLYNLTTDTDGRVYFYALQGGYNVILNISNQIYTLPFSTNDGLFQDIIIGGIDVKLNVKDIFVDVPIDDQYCVIRDHQGNRIITLKTDSEGIAETSLDFGEYVCYFTRYSSETIAVPFQIYKQNHEVIFSIASPKKTVIFEFRYDNGSKVYNLPVLLSTILYGEYNTSTFLSSRISLFTSYGPVNLTVYMKNGQILNLKRTFEPGRETIQIIISSETDEEWLKIPFKPLAGFEFIVSLSFEYMDYYLKGSLLFTYTLAYAEVILILLIVIVNMFTILQNVYRESRRETTIVRMIGGTNFSTILNVFSRLGFIAFISSFLGYGIGLAVLRLLSAANQTVFFGHTFTPSGSWGIFFLNLLLMIFVATISTVFIARKGKEEKSIIYTRR